MTKNDLTKYGIKKVKEVVYNPTYEVLFNEETRPELDGYEKAQETELGALNVMTGIYTGRSPKDKYIVMDKNSKDTVWWDSEEYHNDNHPMSEKVWKAVKKLAVSQLCGKKLYVVDGFCGTNADTRMKVRFIMEVAWQAHFVTNMFIRPKNQAEFDQEPDFVVYCASKAKVENFKELGLRSDTCVAFNVTSKEQVILNTCATRQRVLVRLQRELYRLVLDDEARPARLGGPVHDVRGEARVLLPVLGVSGDPDGLRAALGREGQGVGADGERHLAAVVVIVVRRDAAVAGDEGEGRSQNGQKEEQMLFHEE